MGRLAICVLCAVALSCTGPTTAFGQRGGDLGTSPGPPQLLTVGGGPGNIEQQVAALDFAEMQVRQMNKAHEASEQQRAAQKELVDSGAVSVLDLAAPTKAVNEYNQGITALRDQKSPEAVLHLQKALTIYPKFVSAHNALGMAYIDLDDTAKAKSAFETAAGLDEKFARSYLNLARLSVNMSDYKAAKDYVAKAASTRPNDIEVLTLMAYAQNGTEEYVEAIDTVGRIHKMPHEGKGNVHYIAAAAALQLQDGEMVEHQLILFLKEDPNNPLAPAARLNLEQIARNRSAQAAASERKQLAALTPPSLANTARLKAELGALSDGGKDTCVDCDGHLASPVAGSIPADTLVADLSSLPASPTGNAWTVHKVVDEVALFFAVSSHGHMINDLELSDIAVRDDGKSPAKILQFAPQAKLPLRVGLLIDTSGSVYERFGFEKYAAARFLEHLLTNPSDLAFVAGFSTTPHVVQDFTANHQELESGVQTLKNGGGTALFDAISYACGKLAAYPENERVAKVLVVLSDGEDNSSHATLRRAISDAETSGVTIYAISTKEGGDKTDADKVLQALAERSGGEALFPQDTAALRGSFDKLRDIIRSRYLIAYKPAAFEADGKYRTINVTASRNGSKLQVHSRKGYHARVAPNPTN